MKKNFNGIILTGILFLIISASSNAQYTTAVGVRVGKFASGLNVKHFFDTNANTGVELQLGVTREAKGGYMSKGYFLRQIPIFDSKLQIPVDFIYGIGAHAGYFKENYYRIREGQADYYEPNTISAGIDAVFGLEYDTRRFPISVGIDVNPFYSFLNPGPEFIDFGVNIRMKF
ncbi:MAG: hypothetical protein DWQ39_10845 [Bacteroidetes bacterium]|nr:MAG: hypothetical protein DWQ39_10845 [Bacteroidota bacterium]REK48308.1 MAG: hypothetical protein DWQ48_10820 [Bacteroidota bacterium]